MIDTDYGRARKAAWHAANSLFGPLPDFEVEEVVRIDDPSVTGTRVRLRAGVVRVEERATTEQLPDKLPVLARGLSLSLSAGPHRFVMSGEGPTVVDGEPARPPIGCVSRIRVRYHGPDDAVGGAFLEALEASFSRGAEGAA